MVHRPESPERAELALAVSVSPRSAIVFCGTRAAERRHQVHINTSLPSGGVTPLRGLNSKLAFVGTAGLRPRLTQMSPVPGLQTQVLVWRKANSDRAILEPRVTDLIHSRGLPAIVVAIGFAVVARIIGAVTDGGALAGVLIAVTLIMAAGLPGFLPLVAVFVLTLVSTRWGYARKQRLGVAERRRGRTASQVLANLGPVAMCAVPVICFPQLREMLLAGSVAALAEAAADTVSSEIGQATARGAYLITDFRDVPIGTNGAISIEGTVSGCVAACVISWISASYGVIDWRWTFVVAFAGIGGMFLDSILGATWENAGKLGNDSVNFVSNVFAADAALLTVIIVERISSQ